MTTSRILFSIPKSIFIHSIPEAADLKEDQSLALWKNLSVTCKDLNHMFKPTLTELALTKLLHAVADHRETIVRQILDAWPKLLLETLSYPLIIKSCHTLQIFYADKPLIIAIERRQIDMIKLLLSYYRKLEKSGVKTDKFTALWHWKTFDANNLPIDYVIYLQTIIDIFSRETFPHGDQIGCQLSDATENIIRQFRQTILPQKAIRLDNNYINIEFLIYTTCQVYAEKYDNLTPKQRAFFCIRIFGFLQALVPPETGRILCSCLHKVMRENGEILERALSFLMSKGCAFYRSAYEMTSGMGEEYYCIDGDPWQSGMTKNVTLELWGELCREKDIYFKNIVTTFLAELEEDKENEEDKELYQFSSSPG